MLLSDTSSCPAPLPCRVSLLARGAYASVESRKQFDRRVSHLARPVKHFLLYACPDARARPNHSRQPLRTPESSPV